jgi:hypothetical protein
VSLSIDIHAHAIIPASEAIARSDPGWARANDEAALAADAPRPITIER